MKNYKRLPLVLLMLCLLLSLLPLGAQAKNISGAISGNVKWKDGDVISGLVTIASDTNITVNGTVTMNAGIKITGGVVNITVNGTVTMNNGIEITNGVVTISGGGTLKRNATGFDMIEISTGSLTLNSITLDGAGIATGNEGINASSCSVTMNNGCVLKNHKKSGTGGLGSAVSLLGLTCNFTMNGGEIFGCYAAARGGAVYINSSASFVMTGGVIHDNCTADTDADTSCGGAITVFMGSLTVSGGTIRNNSSEKGGAIFIAASGKAYITGGTFSGNTAWTGLGDAIYLNHNAAGGDAEHSDYSELNIGGDANIDTDNDVYLSNSSQIVKKVSITSGLKNVLKLTASSPSIGRAVAQGSNYTLTFSDLAKLRTGNTGYFLNLNKNNQIVLSDTAASYPVQLDYDANGGAGGPADVTAQLTLANPNASVVISSVSPSRDGYAFLGWATDQNAASATYRSGDTFTFSDDTTLFAVWMLDLLPAGSLSAPSQNMIQVANVKAGREYVITTSSTAPADWTTGGTDYFKATANGSHAFEGLYPHTLYFVFCRIAATDTVPASPSASLSLYTLKTVLSGVTVSMSGYPYGNTPSAPSLSGYAGDATAYYYSTTDQNTGGTAWTDMTGTTLDAGTYYMYAFIAGTEQREDYTTPAAQFTVSRVALTITAKAHTVTYGDALTGGGVDYSGFVAGEDSSDLNGTLAYAYSYTRYGDVGSSYTVTPKDLTSPNYTIGFESGTLTVIPRPVTVTIADRTSVYGAALQTLTAEVTSGSIVNNDDVYTLACPVTAASPVDEYTITGTQTDDNYAVTFSGSSGTAGKYTVTFSTLTGVSVTGYSETYDGQPHNADASKSAAAAGEQTVTWKFGTAAGTYNLTRVSVQDVSDSGTYYYMVSAPNHTDVTGSFSVIVSAKSISDADVTLGTALTYNGGEQTQTVTGVKIDGLDATYSVSSNTGTAANDYTLTVSGTGNFAGTCTKAFSIAPRPAALIWSYTSPFTYDGTKKSVTVEVRNKVSGDLLSLEYTGNSGTDAGSYTATVTGVGNSNYTLSGVQNLSQAWEILKAPVSFAVAGNRHTYDNTTHVAAVTQTAEQLPAIGSGFSVRYKLPDESLSAATADKTDAGVYDVVVTLGNDNFRFDEQADTVRSLKVGTLTVDPRPVTVAIADRTSVYGAALQALKAEVTSGNVVNNDNVYTLACPVTAASPAGDYAITGTQTDDNYAVTFSGSGGTTGKYAVSNATLTGISVTGYNETYDGQSHSADVSKSAGATAGQPVTWMFGAAAGTYDQTHISVRNVSDSGTYFYKVSAPSHADVTGSFSVTVSAKSISDADITLGKSLTYNGEEQTQTVAGVEVDGLDATYSVSSNTGTAANDYTLTVSGTDNFTGTRTKAFSIAPRSAMLIWGYGSPFTFDGTKQTVMAKVRNKVGGDLFSIDYTGNSGTDAGSYTASVTDIGNSNYTLNGGQNLSKEWEILKAPVSFAVADDRHTYDNTAHVAAVTQTAEQLPAIGGGFSVRYKLPEESLSAATADKTDAGVYDILVTLDNDNFRFDGQADTVRSLKVGALTVDKKPVTAQWKDLIHVYDGDAKTPVFDFTGAGIEPGDSGAVGAILSGEQSRTNAGSNIIRATLAGTRAGNYELTNPTGSFIIQRAPVIFTVSNDRVEHDGDPHFASVKASPYVEFTLTYRNAKGEAVSQPTDVGSYEIYAAITDDNYRHAGTTDGTAHKIGVLAVYDSAAPAAYTVSFAGGADATGTMDAFSAQAGTVHVLPFCGFLNDGKTFTGWQYGGSIYQPGERLSQPAANITLTAQWTQDAYAVAGVVDRDGNPLAGTVVTLMLGSEQIGQTSTDGNGAYRFSHVRPGLYNLVACRNGVTQTVLVQIARADVTAQTITMPVGKTSSVVEVLAGSPAIVVGQLEQSFAATENNPCYDSDDRAAVTEGGTVEIKLTAGTRTAPEPSIDAAASGTVGLYLDMTLTKTVTTADGTATSPETLTESATLLEIVLYLPGELQRKAGYTVYRSHDGTVQTLTTTPNAAGEYIAVNADRAAITVYAKCFSSYAVAYTTSGGASGYTPTAPAGEPDSVTLTFEHGTVTVTPAVSAPGTTVTMTAAPDAGYRLDLLSATDSNGDQVALTKQPDGTFTFTQPHGAATINARFGSIPQMPFTDVAQADWFYDDVAYIYEQRLMTGTLDTVFSPHLATTRGMIVTILHRLEGKPAAPAAMPFTDVRADKYYHTAVAWAAAHGIVDGYDPDTFGPDDNITREQLATILWRYAKYKGRDVSVGEDTGLLSYTDAFDVSPYAIPAMQWACSTGLIQGNAGNLTPRGCADRCQVAAVLHRFCEAVVK